MDEKPNTFRFQLHLSTAVALLFVAGGMIWANTVKQDTAPGTSFYTLGFPSKFYREGGVQESRGWHFDPFEPVPLLYDIWVALSFLLTIGIGLELRIRKRDVTDTLLGMFVMSIVCFLILSILVLILSPYVGHWNEK
ncbi:MAG: hypothetical protein WCT04_00980 [Planctomycetota bacterium]